MPMDLLDNETDRGKGDGLIRYQPSTDTPITPLIAYAKEDTLVTPGAEVAVPVYFPGRNVFGECAYFRTADNGQGVWHVSEGASLRLLAVRLII